jgi:hypothetical protein
MWMDDVPDGDTTPIRVPASLTAALVITGGVTLVIGVLPGLLTHFTDPITLLSIRP